MKTIIKKVLSSLAVAVLVLSNTIPASAVNVTKTAPISTVTANVIGIAETLAVVIKNVSDNAVVSGVSFPGGSGLSTSGQYLEVSFQSNTLGASVIISTDNRAATAIPQFASSPGDKFDPSTGVSGGGMVGTATRGHGFVVPLMWVVYDATQGTTGYTFTGSLVTEGVVTDYAQTHAFTDPDEDGTFELNAQLFDSPENLGYASIVSGMVQVGGENRGLISSFPVDIDGPANGNKNGLRPGVSPVVVYLGTNYTGAPAQGYATNTLKLELIHQ